MTVFKNHSVASVLSRHPIHGVVEFASIALRDAHVYAAADVGKVVLVTAPLSRWLITGVAGGVATFRPSFNEISERWAMPAVPHADNEEFISTLAELQAAGWALYDGAGTTIAIADDTIDPYSNDAAAHHVNGNTYRPSWLTLKIRNNNTRYYFLKPWTPATNQFLQMRMGQKGLSVDDAVDIGLVVCAAQAGPKPDPSVRVEVIWVDTTAGRKLRAASNGGAAFYSGAGNSSEAMMMSYLAMGKLGTTWHAWCGGEGAGELYMGSVVNAGTMAYVGFVNQVNSATPGNGFSRVDFLRFVNSSTFIF